MSNLKCLINVQVEMSSGRLTLECMGETLAGNMHLAAHGWYLKQGDWMNQLGSEHRYKREGVHGLSSEAIQHSEVRGMQMMQHMRQRQYPEV